MSKQTESSVPPAVRRCREAIAAWEAQRIDEQEKGLALLRARRRAERNQRLFRRILNLWPLWLAIPISLVTPLIAYVAAAIGSWCMDLVFPFVMLARRPEIQVGSLTHALPTIVLYLQFPVEGLLVYLVLKRNVRPLEVIWQIMLFHFLGLAELCMLSGRVFYWLR